jgi:hypothetical protein
MLGLGALGELALGEGPRLSAKFEPEREFNGQSLIQVIPFVDRELIRRFGQFPDELRLIDRRRFEEVIAENGPASDTPSNSLNALGMAVGT